MSRHMFTRILFHLVVLCDSLRCGARMALIAMAYVGLDQLFVKVSPDCVVQMACMAYYGWRCAAFVLHAVGYRTGTMVQVHWYCEVG